MVGRAYHRGGVARRVCRDRHAPWHLPCWAGRSELAIERRHARAAKRYEALSIDTVEPPEHKPEAHHVLTTLPVARRKTIEARALAERLREAFPTNHVIETPGKTLGRTTAIDGGAGTAWQSN
ncbi:MAG: hypothetical protein JW889_09060 [Verrucomicrobia bacterium]|nr:hypothetical protein [Verrucomicrobiota bacterium]